MALIMAKPTLAPLATVRDLHVSSGKPSPHAFRVLGFRV